MRLVYSNPASIVAHQIGVEVGKGSSNAQTMYNHGSFVIHGSVLMCLFFLNFKSFLERHVCMYAFCM